MLDDIYNNKIIEFASNIQHIGRLDNPDSSSTKVSRLCGSKVTVDIKIRDNIIKEFANDVKNTKFPQKKHSIQINKNELIKFKKNLKIL